MNRQAQAAVLFLTGAALLHAGCTDLYLRYVKAGLRPMLLLSGAVLIATALATAWYEYRAGKGAGTEAGEGAGKEGGEGAGKEARSERPTPHREPRISWLLTLPLFALILVAPPALGSYSAMRTGTALQQPYGYNSLPPKGTLDLSVVDYATRAVYGRGRTIEGRRLRIEGFVALDQAGRPYLVRMALNCCAADAQPVKIALTGTIPPVLRPDKWLKVTGTYTPRTTKDPVNGGPIPYFEVTDAKPIPTPSDPYDETWNT
ncbi:TIGR03943 family putative permease subunit [Streptomyces griseoviridis]|uniref:TIGR03943 family putative permease subunit n=1 Tax=Streptomyces griseoviridis TaxID=45398 RepID=UPI00345409AB